MYATNHFERIILNLARGISATAPTEMLLALYLSQVEEDGSGTEVSYPGYARTHISFSAPAAMNGGIGFTNTEDVTFPRSSVAVGNAPFVALHDSPTGGNMYLYGRPDEPLRIEANEAPVALANEVSWWSTGNLSNAYKTMALQFLRGVDLAGFMPYLALFDGNPESGGAELSGIGYARVPLTFSAPTEQESGASRIFVSQDAVTARSGSAWGTWAYTVIMDAESGGRPFAYIEKSPAKDMRRNLVARINAGEFSIGVN